jgi:hypothetical protein
MIGKSSKCSILLSSSGSIADISYELISDMSSLNGKTEAFNVLSANSLTIVSFALSLLAVLLDTTPMIFYFNSLASSSASSFMFCPLKWCLAGPSF